MYLFFFFNDTATTEIYTLSLHDALPISLRWAGVACVVVAAIFFGIGFVRRGDRKSTRLNSSHDQISYAVFCLKKKKRQLNVVLVGGDQFLEFLFGYHFLKRNASDFRADT